MTTYQRMLLKRLYEEIEATNKDKTPLYHLEMTARVANSRKLFRFHVETSHVMEALEP